ncbi:YbaB/EbfC family nucleoid-associated protein [Nonomuraea sediminis]|uniref:YbaB/EbfC family nucleoid-associated protein n=1 Tax=Nonomuraea sediminis TaxID=2835864 RepID=UPI001BDDB7E2|nr:YbaB/EbfC family nucleoid-associated protein [Nonomuraea sediminis]
MDFEGEFGRLLGEFRDEVRPLEDAQEEVAAIRGHGEAADGQVRAEALPTGVLAGLRLDPRALRMGADALAEAIVEAATLAASDVTAKVTERMSEALAPYVDQAGRFLDGLR